MFCYESINDTNLISHDEFTGDISHFSDEMKNDGLKNIEQVVIEIQNFLVLSLTIYQACLNANECKLDQPIEIEQTYRMMQRIDAIMKAIELRINSFDTFVISNTAIYYQELLKLTVSIKELKSLAIQSKNLLNTFYSDRHGFTLLNNDIFNFEQRHYIH